MMNSYDENPPMRPIIIGALVGLFILMGLIWIVQGNDFFMYKFFAPEYANVQREVFENTQSYVESKRQDLVNYRLQYLQAKNDTDRAAIKTTIVMMYANFDESKLQQPELREFLKQMKYEP